MTEHSEDPAGRFSERLLLVSGYSGDGFAAGFDAHRPSPPPALLDVLCIEAQVERPRLVVDLGSGTGLSTRVWADRADEVVGVEASPEMRAQAEATISHEAPQEATTSHEANASQTLQQTVAKSLGGVRFVQGFAHETGLPDGEADVVTCSQAFHWMEPEPTLAEAARILRPGGVFAAYDYDWPPVVHPEVEAAYEEMLRRLGRMRSGPRGRMQFAKEGHLERIRESGHFRYTRELLLHSRERGSAERIVGMALSLGPLAVFLDRGVSEEEIGLAAVREAAARTLGERDVEMFLGYRVRLGVR